ncbi:MAG: PAS domain-containing protein [Cyclobacteriaceae bacterium]|jgi:PAS domain-containing protein|nr:PAS domain-containing protein [Cytophagales bacterium]MCZ8326765.1 PAS domain-containing protein [Cyclobacteriaceae bacterium]
MIYFNVVSTFLNQDFYIALLSAPILFVLTSVVLKKTTPQHPSIQEDDKPILNKQISVSESKLIEAISKHTDDYTESEAQNFPETINQIFYLPKPAQEIFTKCLHVLCRKTSCFQSILYACDNQTEEITSLANYGLGLSHALTISYGQGQVGQVALNKEVTVLENIPSFYSKIKSGLGESAPKTILIIPILFRKQLQGILEMSFLHQGSVAALQEIIKISEIIGGHMFNMAVLEKQRKQVEQLIKQEEELKETQKKQQLAMQKVESTLEKIKLEKIKNEIILEACQDGVISFNSAGIIDFCNKSASEILATGKHDIVNKNISSLLNLNIQVKENHEPTLIHCIHQQTIKEKTEISFTNCKGEDVSVLATVAISKIENGYQFTLFLQKISVDLF